MLWMMWIKNWVVLRAPKSLRDMEWRHSWDRQARASLIHAMKGSWCSEFYFLSGSTTWATIKEGKVAEEGEERAIYCACLSVVKLLIVNLTLLVLLLPLSPPASLFPGHVRKRGWLGLGLVETLKVAHFRKGYQQFIAYTRSTIISTK